MILPDRWGVVLVGMVWVACVALHRWNQAVAGRTLTLLANGAWLPPGEEDNFSLSPSSVAMGGVLWLHSRGADGVRCAHMLLPDAFAHPQARRWASIWFHRSSTRAPSALPTVAGGEDARP
ncbi:MAG: hypothetical protein KDE68_03495 [Rhodocyclaceae bacterium]|nr:hypothetical protein [Rhodocyclaceae bacterium]